MILRADVAQLVEPLVSVAAAKRSRNRKKRNGHSGDLQA